jgi:hypothetical protein
MDLLKELWAFLRIRKKYWLAPIILAVLLLGLLIASTPTAVNFFVYMGL